MAPNLPLPLLHSPNQNSLPLFLIAAAVTAAAVAATATTTTTTARMQSQIYIRPIRLNTEPTSLAGKLHQVPENPPGKVHQVLPENTKAANSPGKVRNLVSENTVLVLGRRACCMCHVMRRLLLSLGANPTVYDLTEEEEFQAIGELAATFGDLKSALPLVFIGGRLLGGLDSLMAAHMSGELIPMLKQAGALWL